MGGAAAARPGTNDTAAATSSIFAALTAAVVPAYLRAIIRKQVVKVQAARS
jgi:hypothetical protein